MGRPSKIVIYTMGSRGDVQPFFALGSALKAAGYDVHMLVNVNFVSMLEDSELKGDGIFFDTQKEMEESESIMKSMSDGDVLTFLRACQDLLLQHGEEMVKKFMDSLERVKPDLVLSGTGCQALGAIVERRLRIPNIDVQLQCIPENPPKMVYGLPNLPCGCNKLLIKYILEQDAYKGFMKAFSVPCEKLYGFKLTDLWTSKDFADGLWRSPWGLLVGMSPLVAKELDPTSPPNVKYCGNFLVETGKQVDSAAEAAKSGIFGSGATLEAIKSFIAAGSKPVYMGWGSLTAKSPEYMMELVAKAVKLAGSRAIVYQGWAKLSIDTLRKATKDKALIEYAEQNLLFVGKTPHDWLFPQCSCIVHHGGSGTMATAAKSGTPQIITPIFTDQFDHARFLTQFGAGVGFERTQLTKINANQLSEAIKQCESNSQIQSKAAKWGEIQRSEDGCQRVVEHVEWFWTNAVETGKYEQHVSARLAELERERVEGKCCCR